MSKESKTNNTRHTWLQFYRRGMRECCK